jgi:hypothetical protein
MKVLASGIASIVFAIWAGVASAQAPDTATPAPTQAAAKEIPLYSGSAPGSKKWDWAEKSVEGPRGSR